MITDRPERVIVESDTVSVIDDEETTGRAPIRRRVRRPKTFAGIVLVVLVVVLIIVSLVSIAQGAFNIPLPEVIGSITHRLGLDWGPMPDALTNSVLWDIRMPRVVLSLLVGASLGCAGALMQGSFANPLAEPGIIGVSAGAALGAVLSIVLGISAFGSWSVTLAAFAGGLITVTVVYLLARHGPRVETVTLVLTGVAVNAFVGAFIGLAMFFSTDAQLRSITFWNLGSMAQASWPKVAAVAPVALVGLALAPWFARRLDLLALGERQASSLGVDVERLRFAVVFVVAMLTASSVAVAGIITFVGLVVPHLVRLSLGPGHRILLPASMLGGAIVLVVGDLVARTIAAPAEVPLGVLTALVGSPFFFFLLRKTRARQGGWA